MNVLGRLSRVTWIVIAIAVVALGMRLWELDVRAVHHDESLHATYSWHFERAAPLYKHDPLMHGPVQFHAMAAVFKVFGNNDFTARVPTALLGTALVLTPLLFRKWMGGLGTVLGAVFLAMSPSLLYYARFAREDIYAALWTALIFAAVWRYRDDGQERWLALLAVGLALGFATKESIYLTCAILLLYCNFSLTLALLDQRGTRGLARLVEGARLFPFAWALAALWGAFEPLRERLRFSSLPREGDLLITIGILTLPQLAAGTQLPLAALGVVVDGEVERWLSVAAISVLLGGAMVVGMFWDVRRWLIVAGIFYGITIPLFTTGFTNFRGGLTSDFWGALDYWIAQQEVRRGEQPWFYYFMMLPLYEFMTLIPATIGAYWLVVWRDHRLATFLTWWAIGTFLALSYAGEKMPWLLVHLALPLAFLAALTIHEAYVAVRASGAHLGVAMRVAAANAAVVLVLLAAGSVRTAVDVTYGHPDTPIEPLIYTQTSPDVPRIARQIHELYAQKQQQLVIVVDDSEGASWPWAWYLRDLPVVYANAANVAKSAGDGDAVILALPATMQALPELRGRLGSGERYQHRWWFPEEGYRRATLDDVIRGRLIGDWVSFAKRRIPVEQIGAMEAEALFPPGTTTNEVGAGPQPAPPRS